MVSRKLQLCSRANCGRKDAHKTRRLNAAGDPDCTAAHGQTGMSARGCFKQGKAMKADRELTDIVSYISGHARVRGVRLRKKARALPAPILSACSRYLTPRDRPTQPMQLGLIACKAPLQSGQTPACALAAPEPEVGGPVQASAPCASTWPNNPSTASSAGGTSAVAQSIEAHIDAMVANPVLDGCFSRADKLFVHASAIRIHEKYCIRRKRPMTAVEPAGRYLIGLAIFRIAAQIAERDTQTRTGCDGEKVNISVDDVCREVEPDSATRHLAWAKVPAILNVIYQSSGLNTFHNCEGSFA